MLAFKSATQSRHFTCFRDFTENVSVVSLFSGCATKNTATGQVKSSSGPLRLSAGGATV